MKALIPRIPFSGFELANTVYSSAIPALDIKHLEPLITYSEPTFFAVVFSAPASEPASLSVRQKEAKDIVSV